MNMNMKRYQPAEQNRGGTIVYLIVDTHTSEILPDWFDDAADRDAEMARDNTDFDCMESLTPEEDLDGYREGDIDHDFPRAPRQLMDIAHDIRRLIAAADRAGCALDDGNVIDYLADQLTYEPLQTLREALVCSGYGDRFPRASTTRHP